MSALADLRIVAGAPWLGALLVLLMPARAGRGVAIGAAGVVLLALAACVEGAAPVAVPWLERGVTLRLGLGPLAEIGLWVTGLSGLLAVIEEESPRRGRLAGLLALLGTVVTGLLAEDVVVLAGAWALVPLLVLGLVAGGPATAHAALARPPGSGPGRRIAGRAAGVYLSLGAGALLVAVAGLVVAQRAASGGGWSAELAALAAVRVPLATAVPIAAGLALAGALMLGLWPLHAGMVEGTGAGSRGTGRMVAGPVRWLGLDALIRLWAPLAPLGAAAAAPGLGGLAVAGAVMAGLSARIEVDAGRRAAKIALVGWSLAAFGVATLTHEGLCGALILGTFAGLGQAGLGEAGPVRRAVIGLGGALGGALVVIAGLRFADLTLGALGPWYGCAAALALGLAGSAMVDRTCSKGHVRWSRMAVAAVLGLVIARPGALLGRISAAGEAWVGGIALQRCLALALPRVVPSRLPEERPTGCEAPLAGLRAASEGGPGDD